MESVINVQYNMLCVCEKAVFRDKGTGNHFMNRMCVPNEKLQK
jgi:hypothetical protein